MDQEKKYIAVGVPTSSQTGTESNPYLASNAAQFDEIMRVKLVANTDGYWVHIAAGTYFTDGLFYTSGGASFGWVVRSNWTITGAGEGLTIIKFYRWRPGIVPGTESSKWNVIGNHLEVSNVVIENLTVDGNWSNLPDDGNRPPGYPDSAQVALNCVACVTNGPITFRHLTITGFYGQVSSGTECFALCCHSETPFDSQELQPGWLAVFDHCTVHHGHGNYCVGIASFNGGPSIIDGCHIYSLANLHSGAIQAIGRDIQITNNVVRDCFHAFYVDTGNIINLLMERNQFACYGSNVIETNSRLDAVLITVRKGDVNGDFDGVYLDVPIRPLGQTSPYYRVRLYFKEASSRKGVVSRISLG